MRDHFAASMGVILRQSFLNTLYAYAGAVIGFINIVWLFPYVLDPDEFGLTRVLLSAGIVASRFAGLGMGNVTLRFFPEFRDPGKHHHGFLFLAIIIPLAGYLLLSALLYLFRDPVIQFYSGESALFADYFLLIFPLTLFILYFHILESYVRSLYDTVTATFLQDILLRLLQTAAVLLFLYRMITFEMFMWLFAGTFALQVLILLGYVAWRGQLLTAIRLEKITPERTARMWRYALFAILASLAHMAMGNIDMLMIGGMLSLADTAIYAVAFYLASMIRIPSRSLVKIASPMIADAMHRQDLQAVQQIYQKSSINQLLVGGLLYVLVWMNLDHLFRFLPEIYSAGAVVFLLAGLSHLFFMGSGLSSAIIQLSDWYRFDFYNTLLKLLLAIGLNLLLLPVWGIAGAAFGAALTMLLYAGLSVWLVWKRLAMQPFNTKTALLLATMAAAVLAGWMLPSLPWWIADLLVRSTLIAAIFAGGWALFDLSEDFRPLVNRALGLLRRGGFSGKKH